MPEKGPYRIMISGGGTGGHIFPAISIAQALKEILNDVDILFVGAKGRMEMTRVPEAGFEIVGLWISGIQRKVTFNNLLFPVKLISSIIRSFKLIKDFKPHAVVGVGGYASGPLLYAASIRKVPTLIQEQNSYAGLTNKWLSGNVTKICVAHEGMEKYFPAEKLVVTGNPVRSNLVLRPSQMEQAYEFFKIDSSKKTILVIGGSLGARTINESIFSGLQKLREHDVQLVWQTGSFYYENIKANTADMDLGLVRIHDFISQMRYAYAVADLVISRAGALSIAELMLTAKPTILVPSPNVAEDHQTKNAKALVEREAAIMITDKDAPETLIDEAIKLMESEDQLKKLGENIGAMAHPNASLDIANEIIELIA